MRYHVCWGSWPGPHTSDVPFREIADLVLKVNAQAFSIEAANPRHEWEWTVWQDVKLPEGKILLPGVISHAISHVEHPELIAQRLSVLCRPPPKKIRTHRPLQHQAVATSMVRRRSMPL